MPRLLPRLLKALKEDGQQPKHLGKGGYVPSPKRKSLYRPVPQRPSFDPVGRRRSILLDKRNPVTQDYVYVRHKTLPPRVRIYPAQVPKVGYDVPREMSVQEREWWSSPYLRMLSTPLRVCAVSRRTLPADFLIRLAPLRLPVSRGAKSMQVLIPDGLEHPKFKRRKGRTALYVTCWKDALQGIQGRAALPRLAPNITVHQLLGAQISYLLRLRILQEIELLTRRLSCNQINGGQDATILRRLTRAEFKTFRKTGLVPCVDAVAILVVPPVNRDPTTKVRPQPSREPIVPPNQSDPPVLKTGGRTPLPLSTLHRIEQINDDEDLMLSNHMPAARVPLYNGFAMFPSAPQRTTLHKSLCELLQAERRSRRRGPSSAPVQGDSWESKRASGDRKASHAFLLISSERTVKRADSAPLAIALWRLRMWEGDAFDSWDGGGWEVGSEWRMQYTRCM
ncbi:hypothetical protein F5I97DRAFT_910011 [Phlebopus sp. FC_14]|nr:hypothetical protein F5I97DRAFT_910011 [Phlebopus sp. FC_14]